MELTQLRSKSIQLGSDDEAPTLVRISSTTRDPSPPAPPHYAHEPAVPSPMPTSVPAEPAAAPLTQLVVTSVAKAEPGPDVAPVDGVA